ncbi:MAG: hypothetical protein DRI34_00680 [Deltaproteobacteria bacterium]|nr:MAG: hypothetical protein DRI34_00680 [Deltaproteobacteria bacterium]
MNKTVKMILVGVLLLAGSPASRAGGTHFLVEPYTGMAFNLGYSSENAFGLESGAVLAVGGKFKGFPPRFYAYFRASQAFFGEDDVYVSSRAANVSVCREVRALMGGVRVVIPLWWELRLYLEVGGGQLFTDSHYREPGYSFGYSEKFGAVELGTGLNLRLFRWLSLGLVIDYTFVAEPEHGDLIATVLGEADRGSQPGWLRTVATLGLHF